MRDNSEEDEEIDIDDLFSAIIDEARRLKDKEPQETALATTTKPNKAKRAFIKYFNCGKKGHYARECRGAKEETKSSYEETATLAL